MEKVIDLKDLKSFEKQYDSEKIFRVSSNSVKKNGVFNASFNDTILNSVDDIYSNEVKDIGKITDQKQSGRCWMYAGFNVLRNIVAKTLKVKDFEFSESYLFFYDKLEKANYTLELVLENLEEEVDSRKMNFILSQGPSQDGGFWHYFKNLVEKYGVVPASAMKETSACKNSMEMDEILENLMAKDIALIRNLHQKGESINNLRAKKEIMLQEIYNVLVICLGKPVDSFVFEYNEEGSEDTKKDKEKESEEKENNNKEEKKDTFKHLESTPLKFYEDYIKEDLSNYVVLTNYPSEKLPFNKLYQSEMNNNVYEKPLGRLINLDIELIKKFAIASIKDNSPMWFACDVGAFNMRKEGYLVKGLLDIDATFNTSFDFDKTDRVLYQASSANHAMTLVGVNLVNDKPNRWKIMNSWGDDYGLKGYLMMNDEWFNEYVYEVVLNKKYLTKEIVDLLDTEPTILPYYSPFGKKCD